MIEVLKPHAMNDLFPNRRSSAAFTLVELMIAIALVLILMLGVSRVFRITGETISANQAVSENTRYARSIQSTFTSDIAHVAPDGACMVLMSERKTAFRNVLDEASDSKWTKATTKTEPMMRQVDLDGNGVEGDGPNDVIPLGSVNYRSHRTDTFSFFTRGLFPRQTGGVYPSGATPFVADMTSGEAWVWYGQLKLPDDSTPPNYMNLGRGTGDDTPRLTRALNPNNFYATQWQLGREAMLLRDKTSGPITDKAGNLQTYIDSQNIPPAPSTSGVLTPLEYTSATQTGAAKSYTIAESRFDLAASTISDFRFRLTTFLQRTPTPLTDNWWDGLFGSPGRRYQTNPAVLKPITPAILSQQQAKLLSGCTQFIVEYAGDFLAQDNDAASSTYGYILNVYTNGTNGTDGQIDYIVTGTGTNKRKQIRWYGLPRDTDNNGAIAIPAATGNPNLVTDTVPLRDVWRFSTTPGISPYASNAPFEKFTWTLPTRTTSSLTDYASGPGDYEALTGGIGPDDFYTCAWGPNDPRPKMIRITFTLDDPQGRTPDGQTFEYVFELP